MDIDEIKKRAESVRCALADFTLKKWDRMLPTDEMALDRWEKGKKLGFGEGTSVYENVYIYGKPKIGKNVHLNPLCVIDATGGLEIGEGSDIASQVMIFTHSTHLQCVSEKKEPIIKERVKIGNYVFVGSGTTILPGVTIGGHSIIGANSLVNSDIPEYSIAIGTPAKVVGKVKLVKGKVKLEYYKGE